MKEDIRKILIEMSDQKYKDFSEKLIPSCNNMLGVRIPELRKLAGKIISEYGISSLEGEDIYFEEKMLRGFIIAGLKLTTEERFVYIKNFIPKITDWSVCDSFCSSLKFKSKDLALLWDFLMPYSNSEKEFECRFSAVMLMRNFINEEYIERTLECLSEISTAEYYSSMSVAWALAECFIKFPKKTIPYLENRSPDNETLKRTVRKICDSYRVSDDTKQEIKKLLNKEGSS